MYYLDMRSYMSSPTYKLVILTNLFFRKREEHMKKVLAKKQQQERELQESTKRTVEKTKEKVAVTIQIREAKEKAEREKLQKMRYIIHNFIGASPRFQIGRVGKQCANVPKLG
jgi:hypothetical protein